MAPPQQPNNLAILLRARNLREIKKRTDWDTPGSWRVEKHPRLLGNVTGTGGADVVGFGDAGVTVSLSQGNGTYSLLPLFVIPNFGFGQSGPVEQQGPFLPAADAGIVQASGGHRDAVFYVGGDSSKRLWKWTAGMTSWQQLVSGGGATQARRFFVNPYVPNVIYLLDTDRVRRSDDGGVTWQVDTSLEQQLTCGGRIPASRADQADGQGDGLGVVLTDMQFDPHDPGRRFAVGLGGAFMTGDGVNWCACSTRAHFAAVLRVAISTGSRSLPTRPRTCLSPDEASSRSAV